MNRLIHPTPRKRVLLFLIGDVLSICFSLYLSFLVHFNFSQTVDYVVLLENVLPFFLVVKLFFLALFRGYRMTWRYVGVSDLTNIMAAIMISNLILMVASFPFPNLLHIQFPIEGYVKRIFIVDGIFSLFFIGGLRIAKRVYLEVIRKKNPARQGKKTLILGAGNTGEMILRDTVRQLFSDFYPVGLLDDDPRKLGTYIHGVKVLGKTDQLESMIAGNEIEAVIIAIPSLNHKTLRILYDSARRAGVKTIKFVPRIYNYERPEINLKALDDIAIEDLIGRQAINVDYQSIRDFLTEKSILVTGAGGSIGSEIVTQVCSFQPSCLILFDIDETELHNLGLRLQRLFPEITDKIKYVTGDVRDWGRLREVFGDYSPRVVFHAAAYKHVPMMETNPKEAVKVNIFGTYALALASRKYGVEKFIMISTDKAVRPTSVMGATKRMAEHICRAFQETAGNGEDCKSTQFVSVRFGNVLGSRGSVLPLFLDQLKHGGPLTVTHKDMKRYFMTIPEAVSLVLQASTMGSGGEVFVLDMGEPVYILDVAEELVRLHGLEPHKDIEFEFTGLRPGEKLFEEILTAEEGTVASKHEKVFIARNSEKYTLEDLNVILEDFDKQVKSLEPGSHEAVKALLKKYVKHYEVPVTGAESS
ncbi:MAG: UDP-N-acetyl-alpha-D-glucosamine C6 dehydratase [Syntrophus sp. PtaB.Bin001]|nr:MAG: UDP-N-acetyl-alpha-D-glucosamine C6 dehydratase [Syntrophus sp. PtaB.Bin001]